MPGIFDKLKDAAIKAGREGAKNPRLMKAAGKIKETVDAFKEGYEQQIKPEEHKVVCPHCSGDLPKKAKFCPNCGAKVD